MKTKYGIEVPSTFYQARSLDKANTNNLWQNAIDKEVTYQAFRTLARGEPPPSHYQKAPLLVVFDIKSNLRRKTRIVVGGHKVDSANFDSYAPVASLKSFRIISTLAHKKHFDVLPSDVETAYLNATTPELIAVKLGPEFGIDLQGRWALVNKAWYGLSTSAAAWHGHLSITLKEKMKYERTATDPCVWLKRDALTNKYFYILTYVDDVTGYSSDCNKELHPLSKQYKVRDETNLEYHLGMNRIEQKDGSTILSSEKYLSNVLPSVQKVHGELRQYDTPMMQSDKPEQDESPFLTERTHRQFQSLIGIGQWLVQIGRWDIAFALCSLSRFSAAPREGHLDRLLRVFGYLKKHPGFKLVIDSVALEVNGVEFFDWSDEMLSLYGDPPDEEYIPSDETTISITAFVDADHAHDTEISRSFTGYIVFLGSTPISWKSLRQKTIATPTFASELVALKHA